MFRSWKLFGAELLLLTLSTFSRAQGMLSPSEWKALNERDMAKWAQKTGLSSSVVHHLLDVTEGKWNQENQFIIENIDAARLAHRHHILLSTYAAGTGHCMKVYVVEKNGNEYRPVWTNFEIKGLSNLCTESVLGSATARATDRGAVLIKIPERTAAAPGMKTSLGKSELVTARFDWNGKDYELERIERFRRYHWDGSDLQADESEK